MAKHEQQPFLDALRKHLVSAEVMHLDHYRVKGGMAVRTDYIILVQECDNNQNNPAATAAPTSVVNLEDEFDPFMLSKTYSAFRTFAQELKNAADAVTSNRAVSLCSRATKIAKYCELVSHLIESQRQQYLGKVSYGHVKALAKQRCHVVNGVLEATCQYFPAELASSETTNDRSNTFVNTVAGIIETFFLTDHCSLQEMHSNPYKKSKKKLEKQNSELKNPILNPLAGITGVLDTAKAAIPGTQDEKKSGESDATVASPARPPSISERRPSAVVPLTRRDRRSEETRAADLAELDEKGDDAHFVLEDYWNDMAGQVQQQGQVMLKNTNPWFVGTGLVLVAMGLLARASSFRVQMDADWALLLLFAAYCLGLHTPYRPHSTVSRTPATTLVATSHHHVHLRDRSGRRLIRRTLIKTKSVGRQISAGSAAPSQRTLSAGSDHKADSSVASAPAVEPKPPTPAVETGPMDYDSDEDDDDEPIGTQMSEFPEGAELGSVTNCWGRSKCQDFKIRGPNYLKDKKKIPSEEFLFPMRGVDLFLTDTCPENVGSNPAVLNGNLRDLPTFIINFRLPWGVLLLYFEIPSKLVPYLRAGYEDGTADKAQLEAEMADLTPGERCVGRFLMGSTEHKNKTFKIVPVVVKGPWVVRQVVGGKPALIGQKVPISYVYQAPEDKKALYLEADLDIAASSAARGILSVARTYTQVLTLDLGFVVQGNHDDELPEQMLVGCRLHGVDPLTAPSYPQPFQEFLNVGEEDEPMAQQGSSDEGSEGQVASRE